MLGKSSFQEAILSLHSTSSYCIELEDKDRQSVCLCVSFPTDFINFLRLKNRTASIATICKLPQAGRTAMPVLALDLILVRFLWLSGPVHVQKIRNLFEKAAPCFSAWRITSQLGLDCGKELENSFAKGRSRL